MTATYTFDVFATLDGYGSYGPEGDWGGYWGKQGPELVARRRSLYDHEQRMVFGANTFREFLEMLGPKPEPVGEDDSIVRMRAMPTTVVSSTLQGPSTGRTRPSSAVTASTSSPGSRRSPTCRCARTEAWR